MANIPTEGMVAEAKRGLAWRKEFKRGGTAVGVARARDIANRKNLSDETVLRMHSYFSRHEVDKQAEGFNRGEKGYPSAGRIAWALWGGDAGQIWARAKRDKIERELNKMPIPQPEKGESKQDFINRCMGDEVMVAEYEEGQRRAICELQSEYLDGELTVPKNSFRIGFYKSGRKTRKGYAVDVVAGTIEGVSLIQLGEAKGHGLYVDGVSLATALEVLGDANLPAFITHTGALKEDRMLKQIGYFSKFYIDQGKLKAESFQSLESFRDDETESFNRLFDLAREMPDAFGLSLVFEAELAWVLKNGEEISLADSEGKPQGAVRDIPSVRFVSISSADFVDEPAANEDGLFSKKQTVNQIMSKNEITEETEEKVFDQPEPQAEELEEVIEAEQGEDSEQNELSEIKTEIEALKAELAELSEKLAAKTEEAEAFKKALDGEEIALSAKPSSESVEKDIVSRFAEAQGADQSHIWKQNKSEILRAFGRK